MFSKDTYVKRRAALRDKMSEGVLLFLGNVESPMNFADNCFPFRQDSSFLYYFGIEEPNLAAVIDVDSNETILFGDELGLDAVVWMGRLETLQRKAQKVGVQKIRPFGELAAYLDKVVKGQRNVHYLPPYQGEHKILLSRLLKTDQAEFRPSVAFIKAIGVQRSIKEEQEVAEIEKSVHISNLIHLEAMRLAKPGIKEYELVSAMQKIAADHQSVFSYPSILTVHGEILHNHFHGNTLKEGQMVLNDSGVENPMHYAGDLTRTFPVGKKFTTQQREIYQIVHKAFIDAQEDLEPGLNYKEIHKRAALTLVEGLSELGFIKGDPKEAMLNNAHTLFFQTGVGHLMGLDVHDMEALGEQYIGYTEDDPKDTETFGWKSLRLGRDLKAGYVLTVEPGIYFIPELIDRWKADKKLSEFINYDKVEEYRDFGGIRIEDNFLITDNGYKRLGEGLISTVEEVEEFRAQSLS